jgi:hypothetical protein
MERKEFTLKHHSSANTLFTGKLTAYKKHPFKRARDSGSLHSKDHEDINQDSIHGVKALSPKAHVGGKSQAQWADIWWQKVFETPQGQNPLTDDVPFAKIKSVQFLAGNKSTRNLTISAGTNLFAPVINQEIDEIDLDPGWTFQDSKVVADGIIGAVDSGSLFFNLKKSNGTEIPLIKNWQDQLQSSPAAFSYTGATPNIFGTSYEGTKATKASASGYWVMLNPLPPGQYTFHFGASLDFTKVKVPDDNSLGAQALQFVKDNFLQPNVQDITYSIKVVPQS